MTECLDVGPRGGDFWYLECLAWWETWSTGRSPAAAGVHTARGPSSCTAPQRAGCKRAAVGSRPVPDERHPRVGHRRHRYGFVSQCWLEPGAPPTRAGGGDGVLAGYVPVRGGGHRLVFVEPGASSPKSSSGCLDERSCSPGRAMNGWATLPAVGQQPQGQHCLDSRDLLSTLPLLKSMKT